MILYQPQLLVVPTEKGTLFLHSTTFFDTINFKPRGHKVRKKLNKNRVLKVELYVAADNNFPEEVMNMKCINPVVHHVDLGNLLEIDDEGNLNGRIEAIVYMVKTNKSYARSSGPRRRAGGSASAKLVTSGHSSRPNPKAK